MVIESQIQQHINKQEKEGTPTVEYTEKTEELSEHLLKMSKLRALHLQGHL
jgi:hypothetical protein